MALENRERRRKKRRTQKMMQSKTDSPRYGVMLTVCHPMTVSAAKTKGNMRTHLLLIIVACW